MSDCTLTLIGLYNYNPLMFDGLRVPPSIDRDVLIDNILIKGGEFESLYTNPSFIAQLVGQWSNKYYDTFDKWVKALSLEFNPIENYDRVEETTDTANGSRANSINSTMTNTNRNVSDENANTNGLNKISGFNTNELVNDSSSDGNATNHSESNIDGNSATDTMQSERHNDVNTRVSRIHGNIGVTTSSALLKEYLSIAEWNIYEHITDLFIKEFCIMVY